jgi:AcrR family transcriptional regulator
MSSPSAPRRRPPRRPLLSRDAIVAAAVELVDEGGPDGLTMRAVADRLGCGVMSLYRHVPDREALLDFVLDAMARDIVLAPPTSDWRADATAIARSIRSALLRRPSLTLLLTARMDRYGAGLAGLDHALSVFRAAGCGPRDAVLANHALGNYVAGVALWEAEGMAGTSGPEREVRKEVAAAALLDLPAERYPNVRWAADDLFAGTLDDRFEFGLTLLLDGLARRLDREEPS